MPGLPDEKLQEKRCIASVMQTLTIEELQTIHKFACMVRIKANMEQVNIELMDIAAMTMVVLYEREEQDA